MKSIISCQEIICFLLTITRLHLLKWCRMLRNHIFCKTHKTLTITMITSHCQEIKWMLIIKEITSLKCNWLWIIICIFLITISLLWCCTNMQSPIVLQPHIIYSTHTWWIKRTITKVKPRICIFSQIYWFQRNITSICSCTVISYWCTLFYLNRMQTRHKIRRITEITSEIFSFIPWHSIQCNIHTFLTHTAHTEITITHLRAIVIICINIRQCRKYIICTLTMIHHLNSRCINHTTGLYVISIQRSYRNFL